ncbi:MAG TPA: hypothetical protein DDW42_10045 [Desulfobacteraceae bacterium]|nr:hypothetical protein [Desulfobacteraceae bacterium]
MITVLIIVWATPKKVDTELRTRNLPVVSSGKYWAIRISFLKSAKPCPISLNGGLALKFI